LRQQISAKAKRQKSELFSETRFRPDKLVLVLRWLETDLKPPRAQPASCRCGVMHFRARHPKKF